MKLLKIYPIDVYGQKVGGVETCIRTMNENAPLEIETEMIGIATKKQNLEIGKWHDIVLNNRPIKFLPILSVADPNKRTFIPLFLKFGLALLFFKKRINFKDRTLVFHRFEPAFVLGDIKEDKIYFSHGDIRDCRNHASEGRWKHIGSLYFYMEHLFIKQIKHIFVVSQDGCNFYKRKYPNLASRFKFLPTWYDPKIFKLHTLSEIKTYKKTYGLSNKKPIIIFAGRLETQKDPFLLIKTFSCLEKKYPDAILLIAGDGSLENSMKRELSDLGIAHKVIFMGRKKPEELVLLYNMSDLLLLTSAFEGMPRVAMEALACGIPVVSTDTGAVNLVIKNNISGMVVDSRKPEDLANSVVQVMKACPDRESCRQSVSAYSQEKIIGYIFKTIRE